MENNDEMENSVKITLLGNSGVGKTCIILRFTNNEYNDNSISTKGANYMPKEIKVKDKVLNLDIWDTAGQEQYRSLGKHFYKDSFIVILVYDITNKDSFEDLKNIWYKDLKEYGEKYTVLAIVGNKNDRFDAEETVSEEEARKFAEEKNAIFMLVSAKNGDNINNLFNVLATKYIETFFQSQEGEEKNKKDKDYIKLGKKTKEQNKQKSKRSWC